MNFLSIQLRSELVFDVCCKTAKLSFVFSIYLVEILLIDFDFQAWLNFVSESFC